MSNETVDKIRALNAEVERLSAFQKQHHCGFSCDGVNLWGDKQSIERLNEWHRAAQNEEFYRRTITELRAELAQIKEALG